MKGSLEDKIAGAFLKNDSQYRFENKDKVWRRIEAVKYGSGLVSPFWRIAAIFIGIALTGSIWASYSIWHYYLDKMNGLNEKKEILRLTIDSLRNVSPQVVTKVQYVEREKVVYVDRTSKENNSFQDQRMTELYLLVDSLKGKLELLQVMANEKAESLKNEIPDSPGLNSTDHKTSLSKEPAFDIKPAPVPAKMRIQAPPQTAGMKVRFLHRPEPGQQFDSNTTFLKKEP